MPFWMSTTGLPVRMASAGVKAFSLETITSGMGRPWAEVP
jgi:hypothetical protein